MYSAVGQAARGGEPGDGLELKWGVILGAAVCYLVSGMSQLYPFLWRCNMVTEKWLESRF